MWKYEGRRCEEEKMIRVPHFDGYSYLTYSIPDEIFINQELELRLQFSTSMPTGLITYIHNSDASVYLAVYVENSALKFRLSCGQQQMTLVETKRNVSDGSVHNLQIR